MTKTKVSAKSLEVARGPNVAQVIGLVLDAAQSVPKVEESDRELAERVSLNWFKATRPHHGGSMPELSSIDEKLLIEELSKAFADIRAEAQPSPVSDEVDSINPDYDTYSLWVSAFFKANQRFPNPAEVWREYIQVNLPKPLSDEELDAMADKASVGMRNYMDWEEGFKAGFRAGREGK